MAYSEVLIFWCLRKGRWRKFLPFTVLPKWGIGSSLAWSCILGVSEGCLGVFEDIWQCLLVSFCLWMSWGRFNWSGWYFWDARAAWGVFEGFFGDSLHEGFAQTGANSSFWPNRQNGTVGECVPKGGRSIGRQAVMLIGLGIFLSGQQVLVSFQKICDIPWSTNAPSGSRDTNTESFLKQVFIA